MKRAERAVLPGFSSFCPADIFELVYNDTGLRVRVEVEPDGTEIHFPDATGFRLLDERDLLEFWPLPDPKGMGWVFQVFGGGWLELESTRPGFLSNDAAGMEEYLVVTGSDCLSVFSFGPPTLNTIAT